MTGIAVELFLCFIVGYVEALNLLCIIVIYKVLPFSTLHQTAGKWEGYKSVVYLRCGQNEPHSVSVQMACQYILSP